MPKIYDQDLRNKVISNWQKTGNKSKTARLFEINRNTLDEWIKLYQEQANTKPKPFAKVGVKHIITDLVAFEEYVKSKEFDTAKQYNIELKYLPPYSPQLNPIKQLWGALSKRCI